MSGGRGWLWRAGIARGRFVWLVALVVAAVVGSVLVAPASSARAAAEPRTRSCVDVQPSAEAAAAMVSVCRRPVEILSERSEFSQTFQNVDGSRTLEESVEPVRVRQGSTWVPVSTELRKVAGGIGPRAAVLAVVFSAGGDGPLARVSNQGRELAMTWPYRLPAPTVQGDTALYQDVIPGLPGVDLRLTATPLGFSEIVVVRTRQAAASPRLAELRFGLSTNGVTVAAADGGGLAARDGNGRTVFTAPAPLMWDSSGDPSGFASPTKGSGATARQAGEAEAGRDGSEATVPPEGARRAVMPIRVDAAGLTVVPDRGMLSDPKVRLPLHIDPSWTGEILESRSAWTTVWSKYPSSSFWHNSTALLNGSTYGSVGAGRVRDCDTCSQYIIRSLFRMDTSRVQGLHILSAQFRVKQIHSWTCNPASNAKLWMTGGISSATTWNNQPGWDSAYTAQTPANRKVGAIHGCAGPGTVEFDATAMVATAAAANWSSVTVGLRAVDEAPCSSGNGSTTPRRC